MRALGKALDRLLSEESIFSSNAQVHLVIHPTQRFGPPPVFVFILQQSLRQLLTQHLMHLGVGALEGGKAGRGGKTGVLQHASAAMFQPTRACQTKPKAISNWPSNCQVQPIAGSA